MNYLKKEQFSENTTLSGIENKLLEKSDKKVKQFRISAKKMFLTYPQVPEQLTLEMVRDKLNEKLFLRKHLLSVENNKELGRQILVLLEGEKKFNVVRSNFLDIDFQGKSYPGNYQPVRNLRETAEYVAKHGNVLTNYDNLVDGHFTPSTQQKLAKSVITNGQDAFTCKLMSKSINQALKNINAANADKLFKAIIDKHEEEGFAQANQLVSLEPENIPVKFQEFDLTDHIKKEILEWFQNDCQPTLILAGPSGYGKTLLALALFASQRRIVLEINDFQGLKQLKAQHNGILYDSPTFQGLGDTQNLAKEGFGDTQNLAKEGFGDSQNLAKQGISESQLLSIFQTDQIKTQFRLLGTTVSRPGNIAQIITMSYEELGSLKKKFLNHQFARRMIILDINQPIIDVNINVKVQAHAKAFNNKDKIKANLEILDSL